VTTGQVDGTDRFATDGLDDASRAIATAQGLGTDGAELLTEVYAFLGRFIAYPSEHAQAAHALWVAHTHLMDRWESTPRIAFLSPEPGSGKSRALEVTESLVPRPVHAVSATSAYLFRKVSSDTLPPTILYDEIDTVFGPKAKDNEDVRAMLNAGHRRSATAGRCVVRGKVVETEELPAYCAVALAGLNDMPDTIMTRSIVVRMQPRMPDHHVEPWRDRVHRLAGEKLRDRIAQWATTMPQTVEWPELPPEIVDRDADVWEPLFVVAEHVGGVWPSIVADAARSFVKAARHAPLSLGVQLLRDVRQVFQEAFCGRLSTVDLLSKLCALDETPWGDLRGRSLDARRLSGLLRSYGIKPRNIHEGEKVFKGYYAADFADAWSRYLHTSAPAEQPEKAATSATPLPIELRAVQ
jgi:hypothetical protein